ncbi:MAG: hypothetical protein WC959_12465 [Kiritimatiellales bacterium]
MTSLELLQEIDAWLSFNNSPSKEQIRELRIDIKKHISEQLNILHVNNLAKLAEFVKQQKDLPPEINDIVNDNFWDLI